MRHIQSIAAATTSSAPNNAATSPAGSASSRFTAVTISIEIGTLQVQTCSRQHAAAERYLDALQQRADTLRQDFNRLHRRFREPEEHLATRFAEVEATAAKFTQRCRTRRLRLASLEQLRYDLLGYAELKQFCERCVRVALAPSANAIAVLHLVHSTSTVRESCKPR